MVQFESIAPFVFCKLLFLVNRSFLLFLPEGCIAENTDQFVTHFSLLFLFVLNVGFVTSSSTVSLPSAALLGITYLICFYVSKIREGKIREKEVHTEKAVKKSIKKIPEDFEDAQSMVTDSCEIQTGGSITVRMNSSYRL